MESASLRRRTLGGVLWMSVDRLVLFVVAAVTTAVLARLLPPSDFGVFGAALVAVELAAQITGAAVTPALVQREKVTRAHMSAAFWISVGLSLGLYGAVWVLTPVISGFFSMPALLTVLPSLAVLFVVDGMSAAAHARQLRSLDFREAVVIRAVADVVGLGGVSITLAVLDFGVWALVGGRLAQSLLRAVGYLARFPHPVLGATSDAAREIARFGGGVSLQSALNALGRQGDSIVIGSALGATSLGLYNRAYAFMSFPASFLARTFSGVLFPVLSRAQAQPAVLRAALRRSTGLLGLLLLPVAGTLSVLAPELVWVALGPDWVEAVPVVQVLALAMLSRTGYRTGLVILGARGRVYTCAALEGVHATLVVGGALVGWSYGLEGVAVATAVAITLFFALTTGVAAKETGGGYGALVRALVPGIILGLGAAGGAYGVAAALRAADLPPVVTLLAAAAAALVVWVAAVAAVPRGLGEHAAWLRAVASEAFGALPIFESASPADTPREGRR